MSQVTPLVNHLGPDTISRLEQAAQKRHDDAVKLLEDPRHHLAALYLLGYTAEMCLAAASYRAAGLAVNQEIDRDTRNRRLVHARQFEPTREPHPIVGWACLLRWQRSAAQLTPQERQRLNEAINRATTVYKHWRPALRYKTANVAKGQLDEVRKAAIWFLGQRGHL